MESRGNNLAFHTHNMNKRRLKKYKTTKPLVVSLSVFQTNRRRSSPTRVQIATMEPAMTLKMWTSLPPHCQFTDISLYLILPDLAHDGNR